MRFVDWLAAAGQSWWQVLPLGPPDRHGSPYKASSAFAAWRGLLADPDAPVVDGRARRRSASATRYWIDDWAAFAGGTRAVNDQVRFDREWAALRAYAAERGVRLIGDVPIYVAPGSADHVAPPRALPRRRRGRRRRPTPSPTRASCGATRSTTGRRCAAGATAGGSSACAAPSSSSTSRASTTSAASCAYWAVPARGARRLGRAAGCAGPGRAVFDAAQRRARRACRSSPRTSASSRRRSRACASRSACPAWSCCSSASTPTSPTASHGPSRHRAGPGPLHGHPRQRHAARLVRVAAAGVGRAACARRACAGASRGGGSWSSPSPRSRGCACSRPRTCSGSARRRG